MKTRYSKEMSEVNRLYRETDGIYSKYAAMCGVSTTALCLLYSLYCAEGVCTQTRLAEDWGLPVQTVNSCLKTMEKQGDIRLAFAAGSRKHKQIFLTKQGEALTERVVAPMIRAENAAFGSLSGEERRLLLTITKKHNALLRQLMNGAGE